MPKSSQHRPFLTRALVSGFAAIYLFTNVASVHATESVFWGERRRAARARFQSASAESGTPPLYAQLPKTISATPDFSTVLDRVSPQTAVNIADLGKAVAQTTDRRILDVAQGILPYGNIRFVRESKKPGAPLILHIQDVHGNLEAQKNMADMILALARDHGVQLAGLEGATGAFATDEFKPYPDQEAVRKVAAYFMKKDILGGPEYAALASEKPITLWGIEDPALYQANVKAVKESLAGRTEAESFLASLTGALDTLKKTYYSDDLQAFDKNQTLYDQSHRGLGEYVQTLTNFDGRTDVVLSHAFPNISRLLSALREEKKLDFPVVERDRQALVEKLVEKLTQAELQGLVRRSVDLRGGKTSHNAYHAYLQNLCARKGLSLSRYPSLTGYMHYVAASETIDREELLKEMGSLETSAQDTLTKTPEQRKLANLSRDASLLKKLIANEMTPDAWAAYKARQTEIANLPARLKELDPIVAVRWPESMTQFLSPFESFCARAMDRNAALTGRLLEKMTQDKHPVAVLVAGGFHTEGLMDILAKQGASVAVLTPKIGQVDPNHRYLDAFAQDPLPLEKIFNGETIEIKSTCGLTLPETLAWLHSGIVGVLLKRMSNLQRPAEEMTRYLEKLGDMVKQLKEMKIQVNGLKDGVVSVSLLVGNISYELNLGKKGDNFLFSKKPAPAGAMAWLNQLIFKGKLSLRDYAIYYSWKIENGAALCVGLICGLVSLLIPGLDVITAIEIAHSTTWLSFAFGHFHDFVNDRRSGSVGRNMVAWGLSVVLLSPLLFVNSLTLGTTLFALFITDLLSFPLHRATNIVLDRWFTKGQVLGDEGKTEFRGMVGTNWEMFVRGGVSGFNPESLFTNLSNDPNNRFLFELLGELEDNQIVSLIEQKEKFYSWFYRASRSPEFLSSLATSQFRVNLFNPGFMGGNFELNLNQLIIPMAIVGPRRFWIQKIRRFFAALVNQTTKAMLYYFLASPNQIRNVSKSIEEAIQLADEFKRMVSAPPAVSSIYDYGLHFRMSKPVLGVIDKLIPLKVDAAYVPEYLETLRLVSPEAAVLAMASYKKKVFEVGQNPLLMRHSLLERLRAISRIVPGGIDEFAPGDLFRIAHMEPDLFNQWAYAANAFELTAQESVDILGEEFLSSFITHKEIERIALHLKGMFIPKTFNLIYLIRNLNESDVIKVKKLLEGVDSSLRDKLIKALTLLNQTPLTISWERMLELTPEELNRWAGTHAYEFADIVDYLDDLVYYVLKKEGNENAIDFFLKIIKTRDISTANVVGELRQQVRRAPANGFAQNYLCSTFIRFKEDPRNKAKILIELNEWMKVSGASNLNPLTHLSNRMEILLASYQEGGGLSVNGLLKEMRDINREAQRIRFKEITGLDFPDKSPDVGAMNDRINVLISLYYSISTLSGINKDDSEKMRNLIAEGLRKWVVQKAEGGSLRHWVLEFPENQVEMASLNHKGYNEKLWTQGILVEGFSSGGQTEEQKETQRTRHYHQIIEIGKLLGFATEREMETKIISTHKEAVDYIDSMLNREDEAIQSLTEIGFPDPHAEFELRVDQLEGIRRSLGLFEESQSGRIEKPEPVTVRIQKHFLNESNAGVGVPGCFNPLSGIHKEMPVMHSLEANTFFAMAYDKNGTMIANTVLVLTDEGVLVFGDYNKSSLNLSALWAVAWSELAKLTPGVFLVPSSAGYSEFAETDGAMVKDSILTRRKTIWVDPYFDFGETDENGNSTFHVTGIKVDRDALSKGGGSQKFSQLRAVWEKRKAEEPARKRGTQVELTKQIGIAIAADPVLNGAKAFRILARLKDSRKSISDVTKEDILGWLKDLGIEESLADKVYQLFKESDGESTGKFRGGPGALGLWDRFAFSKSWNLAQRGWAEGWGTGMLYLVWLAGAMASGFIPLAPPGLDVGSLLVFPLASLINPSLAFGVGIAVLSLSLHRLTGVKLRILDFPVKDWFTVLVASFKSLSGLAGVPLIGVGVSLAAMGGAFGLPWMILGVAAGAFLVRYGIQIGAETHQRINEQVESPPLNRVPAVLEIKKISETGSQGDKNRLNEELDKNFLSGPARPVWFDFNDLKREYHVSAEKPKNAKEFRRFLRNSFKDLPSLDEQSVWWNMLSPEPIQMGGTVDHARKDNNFRVALAHWAMAELLLASHGIMGVRFPAVRRAASLEKRVIGEFASRAPKDRLIRAVKALALLRAAGSSLSDTAEAKGIGVNQERDIRILFSATGASGLSLWESIETAYNEVLRQAGTSDVWRSLAENHSGLSSGEGSQALSSPTTVYFNVDALLDNSPNRRHVVEALKGQLLARREGAEKNRLVLITSQKDLLKTMGVKTEQDLLLKWGRDWRWSHGPAIDALKEVGLLYDGSPSLKQGLISSTQVVSREGISTTVRSFRLEALQAHSNAMGNSAFELWTDDPGRVDKGTLNGSIVVDLMKMGESIERALKAVRFLAISA